MATMAEIRANAKYRTERTHTSAGITFYPRDAELYEWLRTKDNKTKVIKDLMRAQMEREIESGEYVPRPIDESEWYKRRPTGNGANVTLG